MADLASGLADSLLQKLGSLVYQELYLAWGAQSDLQKLERTISTIKIVLLDAEYKQANNPKLSIWLRQLKDILYDAEDVIDEIEYKALRKQAITAYGSTSSKVRHFISSSMALSISRLKLVYKIKDIRERLDDINAEKVQFNLIERNEEVHVMPQWRGKTHSFIDPSTIIGGLGKTTLVKAIYNDGTVYNLFELRMWVCVSEDFNATRLVEEILKSTGCKVDKKSSTEDTLQTSLRELLKDKKFLLVLDDVWNKDRNKWIELINLLNGGSHGSVVVVTTRSHNVSSILDPIYTHSLDGLSNEESLSLFVKCAFKEGEDKRHPGLLSIAEEIVKKCKGVLLAVKSLGGILYSKVDEREWNSVRDNEIWELEENERGILPALRLNYNQMLIHLK
ncbi:disease resistance protein RGA2-like [Carya illinoinensis]|uniref:disease resistance protein RGA2-like n=1 Tax=Carya illinoinensis TaxID=32201 RepID=UPI001C72261F|nr:disease resistance protein RGA2-like [Carya illinoinensis]